MLETLELGTGDFHQKPPWDLGKPSPFLYSQHYEQEGERPPEPHVLTGDLYLHLLPMLRGAPTMVLPWFFDMEVKCPHKVSKPRSPCVAWILPPLWLCVLLNWPFFHSSPVSSILPLYLLEMLVTSTFSYFYFLKSHFLNVAAVLVLTEIWCTMENSAFAEIFSKPRPFTHPHPSCSSESFLFTAVSKALM